MAVPLMDSTLPSRRFGMKEQDANDERSLARARARRTALIVGMVAIAIYLVAIGEVVLHR